jgi:hypothetical protein
MLSAEQENKLKRIDDFIYKVYNNETLGSMHQTILLYNKELIKAISSLLKFFYLEEDIKLPSHFVKAYEDARVRQAQNDRSELLFQTFSEELKNILKEG